MSLLYFICTTDFVSSSPEMCQTQASSHALCAPTQISLMNQLQSTALSKETIPTMNDFPTPIYALPLANVCSAHHTMTAKYWFQFWLPHNIRKQSDLINMSAKLHDPPQHSCANFTAPALSNDLRPCIAECLVRCSRCLEHKTIIGELIDIVSCCYTSEMLWMKVSGAHSVNQC